MLAAVVAAAIAVGICICSSRSETAEGCDASEAVLKNIMTRTSIRAFTDQAVEESKVEALLRAGMAAPTAVNKQPWAVVVVREREQLDRLREAQPNARMLATAQLAIVVCGDMEKALEGAAQSYWVQDTSAATENILLAAHALGLGAVWTGVYPNADRVAAVSEALGLPSQIIPLNVIPIGYPDQSPEPKDTWNPANVHYERW